jgi:aminoglycoside phosphotransferase (APT) family kinase protein
MVSSSAEWDPEVVVEAALAEALAGCPASAFAQGWDKTVFLVGEDLIAFCRRRIAVEGMRREIGALPKLAPELPLPVPVPLKTGTFVERGWPWWTMRRLPGVELIHHAGADLDAVGRDLGAFLRRLHGLAPPSALPVDPMLRSDAETRGRMARERLGRLGIVAPSILHSRLGPSKQRPVLSHGDLHARHVLVHGERCTGVIDWGDICLADPAVDLSLAYSAFEGSARVALLDEYGPVDEEREIRARVLGIFLCSALAETAAAYGDDAALDGALAGIRRAEV